MKKICATLLGKTLIEAGQKIISGECALDDEEIETMYKTILHRKITLEQVCQIYGFSRATLFRKIHDGLLPEPKKDSGGKEYFWQDEVEEYLGR